MKARLKKKGRRILGIEINIGRDTRWTNKSCAVRGAAEVM
jgi:hypothetical protein